MFSLQCCYRTVKQKSKNVVDFDLSVAHLSQAECLWLKEQCLLLPGLEDSYRREPVHCS